MEKFKTSELYMEMELTNIPSNLSYKMEKRPNVYVPSDTFDQLILEHHFQEDESTQGSSFNGGSLQQSNMGQLSNLSLDSDDEDLDVDGTIFPTLMSKHNKSI